MKTTPLFFFLLLLGLSPIASGQNLSQLEAEARAANGREQVDKYLSLSDAQLQAGDFSAAADAAEEAADAAKKLGLPALRALALNREGRAMARAGKRNIFGKDRAAPKFQQSIDILQRMPNADPGLLLDNLENLRTLALRSGRESAVAEYDAQINALRGGPPTLPGGAGDAPVTRQELRDEFKKLQLEIARQRSSLPGVNDTTRTTWAKQTQNWEAQLAAKEAQIDRMNQQQMRDALVLMQQQQMLDSLGFRTSLDSLALANQGLALNEARASRNFQYAIIAVLLVLAGGALYSFMRARQNARVLEAMNATIRTEQERSEGLLLNILPALVAEELKKNGRTEARFIDMASVLFADFVGFSKIAESVDPQQLVNELDTCFQAFDEITARHGLEKIKTIGDAYMCAGGLMPGGHSSGDQVRAMLAAAREMQNWLAQWNAGRDKQGLSRYEARIGIHRGPVVAGVVGSKKFAFDIWGDTVNVAARVEQAGVGGKINISGAVYEAVKHQVDCRYRGKIATKNRGEIEMYFVEN